MPKTNKVPSAEDFERVLRGNVLSPPQLKAIRALYNFPDHSATAPQLAAELGHKGFGGANLVMGKAGRKIANELGINAPWASGQHDNWFSIIADAKGVDIGCLWVMHPALVNALENSKLVAPTSRNERSTYLFITKPEYKPGKVRNGKNGVWSCSKTTKAGDHALVFVGGEGIHYQWRAISNAEPDEQWHYVCEVEYVGTLEPPITLSELRAVITKKVWGPPHQNFRGLRSIIIPGHVLDQINAMRSIGHRHLNDVDEEFDKKVSESLKLSSDQRRKRLSSAQRQPATSQVVTTVFLRNPDVVAEVLSRAGGCCESCGGAAPFLRASDSSPYLEVHHRVRLADGGKDTVNNALALCPNCHRKAHYG